jgi:hypothetical protein
MDFSTDQLRRDRRDAAAAQAEALPLLRRLFGRVLDGSAGVADQPRAELLSGGVSRRRFLALGGFTVATSAVVAACGATEEGQIPQSGLASTTTTIPAYPVSDLALVRTASSLEYNVIDAYGALSSLDTMSAEARELAAFFAEQHREHAAVFEAAAEELGGNPFTRANPVVYDKVIAPALQLLANQGNPEQGIVRLAHGLETLAGATYQTVVPVLTAPALRSAAMSVGGIEARHSAMWVPFITEGAIAPELEAPAAEADTTAVSQPGEPVYAVPGPYGSLAPARVQVGTEVVTVDVPGPNSFMYPELGE